VPTRTYRQYCALARTLDIVGDRWALLIVRELLGGPKRYSDVLDALGGIGTSVLAGRLRSLEADGVVRRRQLPPPAASAVYELTAIGEELGDALLPLITWGARHALGARRDGEAFRAEWPLLVLQRAIDPAVAAGVHQTVQFDIDGSVAHLRVVDGHISVHAGPPEHPADVVVSLDLVTLVDIGAGRLALEDAVAAGRIALDGRPEAVHTTMAFVGALSANRRTRRPSPPVDR
jgi:DNA-binding HxlR family transcriptional regulator/putative sterol carrier protein